MSQDLESQASASIRLDLALVELGLARSRTNAHALIDAKRVMVDGREGRKASQPVHLSQNIVVLAAQDYVSRAGHKLAAALDEFGELELVGLLAMDVGASTGGFTDVLLRRGVRQVIALDVGHSQMAKELTENRLVVNIENFNARELSLENLNGVLGNRLGGRIGPESIGVVVADLSFISLTLVLEQICSVAPNADLVLLIKPQFEVGKTSLDASGIVNDHRLRSGAIKQVLDEAARLKLGVKGLVRSSLPGTHGNIEYVVWLSSQQPLNQHQYTERIEQLARER